MNDSIKLPENNYVFQKIYSDDKFMLNQFGGFHKQLNENRNENEKKYEKINEKKYENIEYISKDFVPKKKEKHQDSSLQFCDKAIYKKHKFELDMFKLSDYEFVNWANQHTQYSDFLIMAVMAEMKKSPKMRDEIEKLRSEIYKIPLMPIHEYKKIRKLGDRYTSFLRQLKHEYGNHLLRLLYLTST